MEKPIGTLILFTIFLGGFFELFKHTLSPSRAFLAATILAVCITFTTFKLKEGLDQNTTFDNLELRGNVYSGGGQFLENVWFNPLKLNGRAFGTLK
jgi:hypothetical protein|uniref:Uncharacterized protein n=1 Tax=viral metagenome TaxID=1070528 RepID=A0A6C0LRM1_9ZZZZ